MSRLVITDLVVAQFRKFAAPTRLAGLGPGLNLLTAENEAGKSTLKAALDAAFFERHRLTGQAVEAMANRWNEAAPTLHVAFDLDGAGYALTKRFARQPRAVLRRPDGSIAEGDAAEQQMQALLGFEQAGRGAIKPEQLGIWGLLWLAQGDSLAEMKVAASAKGPLQDSLVQGEVAAITGGRRGQRVPQAVKVALGQFLSETGRPTGRYRTLLHDIEVAETELNTANKLRAELAERLSALAATRRDLTGRENAGDPEVEKDQIAAARAEVQAARALAGEVASAETAVALAKQLQTAATRDMDHRQAMIQSAADLAELLALAHTEAAQCGEAAAETGRRFATVERQAMEAAEADIAADRMLTAVREAVARQTRQGELVRTQATLTQALAAARMAQAARRAAEASPATPEALKRLRQLASQREARQAARAAAATQLRFALSPEGGVAVRLDGAPLAADATVDLLRAAHLSLGGLGQVEIRPGVQDAASLERETQTAERAFADALAALGAADLAGAEAQADRRTGQLQQAEAASERARLLAPEHVGAGALAEALVDVEAQLAAGELEAESADLPDEDTARTQAIAAAALRESAVAAMAEARQATALAAQRREQAEKALAAATARHAATAAKLASARDAQADAALQDALPQTDAALAKAEEALMALRQRQAQQGEAATLTARLERLETARDRRQQRVETLKLTVVRLETEIGTRSERGPDEAVADAEATLERLTLERASLERRVAALRLLDQQLAAAKAQVEARYLAPVTAKLRPHLTRLFGEADLGLDGEFGLQQLRRADRAENVADLSAGTREQLAILARLAFAEVLAEQGRPVVLVLDDVLVFADDRRIDDMFTALEHAARHMQVIVLSCRERLFDGLGGKRQRRLAIQPAEVIDI